MNNLCWALIALAGLALVVGTCLAFMNAPFLCSRSATGAAPSDCCCSRSRCG